MPFKPPDVDGSWTEEKRALWQKLERYEFDDPKTKFTFAKRLAAENGWSLEDAGRAIEEYKRFAFLCMYQVSTPSFQVDQVWHLHLTFTRKYWEEFCKLLPRPLHHDPTKGGPAERKKYWHQYVCTLESYRNHFGEVPADLWPAPSIRFGHDVRNRWVNLDDFWLLPKPNLTVLRLECRPSVSMLPQLIYENLVKVRRRNLAAAIVLGFLMQACNGDSGDQRNEVKNGFLGELSGKSFLYLFFLFGILSCCASCAIEVAWRRFDNSGQENPEHVELDVCEVAYLNGGREATLHTCTFKLLQQGLLVINADQLEVRDGAARNIDLQEQGQLASSVMAACRTRSSLIKDPGVRAALDSIRIRLVSEGLLTSDSSDQRRFWAKISPFACLLLLALPRMLLSNGRPIGYLLFLSICFPCCGLFLGLANAEKKRTAKGDEYMEDMQGQFRYLIRNQRIPTDNFGYTDSLGMGFALFGTEIFMDGGGAFQRQEMAPLMGIQQQTNTGGGGDGGGCGGGDGGGDGGDGGGCGG